MVKDNVSNHNFQADDWSTEVIRKELEVAIKKLNPVGPCITLFGSSRAQEDHPNYQLAVATGKAIAKKGFGIITGGGPGIMEAGNKGAKMGNGLSIGLNIDLPFEQLPNSFIDKGYDLNFEYFFSRKLIFAKYSQAFVVFPGGMGTVDELFEILTLLQTNKIKFAPIILVNSSFWKGLLDWIRNKLLSEGMIDQDNLNFLHLVDTKAEVLSIIDDSIQQYTIF